MERRKITPPMLAVKVGADRTTVYNWMAGRRLPEAEYYGPLCKALHVRHAQLLLP